MQSARLILRLIGHAANLTPKNAVSAHAYSAIVSGVTLWPVIGAGAPSFTARDDGYKRARRTFLSGDDHVG
jgi:hypothetical protein